jgi:hypothetical protein
MENDVINTQLRKAKKAGALIALGSVLFGLMVIILLPAFIGAMDFRYSILLVDMLVYDYTLAFILGLLFAGGVAIMIGSRRGKLIYTTESDLFLEGFLDANYIYMSTLLIVLIFSVHVEDYSHAGEVIISHFIGPIFFFSIAGLIPLFIIGSIYWWLLKRYIKSLGRTPGHYN